MRSGKIVWGSLAMILLLMFTSCQECSIVEDKGNPPRYFKLVDSQGNDLWFGPTAQYDPQQAELIHPTEGNLALSVNASLQAVSVVLPITEDSDVTMALKLDSVTTEDIRYTTLVYDEECVKVYELSYVFQNGVKVCGACGNTQFNKDRFIYLKR